MIEIRDGIEEGDQVLLNPRVLEATIPGAGEAINEEDRLGKILGLEGEAAPAVETPPGRDGAGGESPASPAEGPNAERPAGPPAGSAERGEGRRGQGRGRRSPQEMLDSYDANKDGKLTPDEVPEQMQRMFEFGDANGDGTLDTQELGSMGRGRRGGRGDAPSENP
jgi:hypothetical protein